MSLTKGVMIFCVEINVFFFPKARGNA